MDFMKFYSVYDCLSLLEYLILSLQYLKMMHFGAGFASLLHSFYFFVFVEYFVPIVLFLYA